MCLIVPIENMEPWKGRWLHGGIGEDYTELSLGSLNGIVIVTLKISNKTYNRSFRYRAPHQDHISSLLEYFYFFFFNYEFHIAQFIVAPTTL